MAITIENTQMKLSTPQMMELLKTRERVGYHIYYQADGTPTNDGYLFSLPSHPGSGDAEVAVVVEFAAGYKTFELRYDYDEGDNHIRYNYIQGAGRTAATATRQYNQEDAPVETAVTNAEILPGIHVVRIRIDDDTQEMQFHVDQNVLLGETVANMEFTNLIRIKTENGRVFEAHYVADSDADIYDSNKGHDPHQGPRLTPGCYVEVRGVVAAGTPDTRFLISELSAYEKDKKQDIEVEFIVPLPHGAEYFVYYVKYFREHLIVDGGAGIKVYKHNFKAPARYYPKFLWTENVTVVCNNYVL